MADKTDEDRTARHEREIKDLVDAFGAEHAALVNAPPELQNPGALAASKAQFSADIQTTVARHRAEASEPVAPAAQDAKRQNKPDDK